MELAAAAAADAVKRLTAGESWDAVAKSAGATVLPPKFISRADQEVPVEIRAAAFGEPKPSGKPLYSDARLANGDAAVIALSAVREEPAESKPQDADMRRQFAAQVASGEAQSYAAGARADAKVILNPQAIE
jgi:hypothetical protein